jgi:Trp operon repressor
MSIRTAYGLVFIIVLISCGDAKKQELPQGILSPDSMAAVMCRVHLTEAAILQRQLRQDSIAKEIAWQTYRQVLEESKVDYETFVASFEFYRNRPEEFQKIYDKVLIELGDEQATLSGR